MYPALSRVPILKYQTNKSIYFVLNLNNNLLYILELFHFFLNQLTDFGEHLILYSHSFLISYIHQFDSAEEGTPVKNSGFCGLWSLKNAEVLFKNSYTKESGGTYGPVSLDQHPMVKHKPALFIAV